LELLAGYNAAIVHYGSWRDNDPRIARKFLISFVVLVFVVRLGGYCAGLQSWIKSRVTRVSKISL
jgi:hypothetical protein